MWNPGMLRHATVWGTCTIMEKESFRTLCAQSSYEEARGARHLKATYNLGVLRHEQGDVAQARRLWEEAHLGGHIGAAHNLGVLLFEQGEHAKAKALIEEAYRGGDVQAAYSLGQLYQEQGERKTMMGLFTCGKGLRLSEQFRSGGEDLNRAMKFYEEARMGGVAKAADALQTLLDEYDLRPSHAAIRETGLVIEVGDYVKIHSLSSDAGRRLNGLVGRVVRALDGCPTRYGVQIADQGEPKAIQSKNLTKLENRRVSPTTSDNDKFEIGDIVWVHGLKSHSSLPFNGLSGRILNVNPDNGRYGVELYGGIGVKSIKPENLSCRVQNLQSATPGFDENPSRILGELPVQTAIEASIADAASSHDVAVVNAQIGDALLRSSAADDGAQIVLLKFSRRPAALQKMLLEADELAPCRSALEAQGFSVTLPSGAKMLVQPDHYGPALEAIRLYSLNLHPNHVLVEPNLERMVIGLAKKLCGRESVYPKSKDVLPLEFATVTHNEAEQVVISRTFVHIRVPSSLRSESDAAAPRTASTTDADPRKRASGQLARGASRRATPP